MKNLKDKAIVITGAGGTIAGAVQEALAEAGARPILVDRNAIRIQGRAESYGTIAIEEDLLTRASAERAAAAAREWMGRVDGLVHLVGDIVPGRLEDVSDEDFDQTFDSNVRTLFHTVRAFLPLLRESDEAFIASIGAKEAFRGGSPGATLFAAAKGAAATLLRSLDAELEGSSIRVSIVMPLGPIDTGNGRDLPSDRRGDAPISPEAIGAAFRSAILASDGGRLLEVPIHPPR